MTSLRIAGLFAGIGGMELGFERAGHKTAMLCDVDEAARAVLAHRFPGVRLSKDVTTLSRLPARTDMVTAGFPCQDLSQAGHTKGLSGARSGLVGHVFRLLATRDVPWVLLENVPFMRHLARGAALNAIVSAFERAGYHWAYRVIDTRAFGLPQRRERLFILASKAGDPCDVLLSKDVGLPTPTDPPPGTAFGFYWTEGRGGLGWAVNAVPTLKNGSTIGIASPPAIWLPDGRFVKPGIRDAERMQGFGGGWTKPADAVDSRSSRWRLVGNAVTVDVAEWIGQQLVKPGRYRCADIDLPLRSGSPWPQAAYNVGDGRFVSRATSHPVRRASPHLSDFLCESETVLLSHRAISGFLSRFEQGNLRPPTGFLEAAREHQSRMARLTA